MRSVSIFNQPPQKLFQIKNNRLMGFFDKYLKGEYHGKPRQNYPKTYLPNGYIDAFKPKFFTNKNDQLFGKILPFITDEILDIDEKKILKNNIGIFLGRLTDSNHLQNFLIIGKKSFF